MNPVDLIIIIIVLVGFTLGFKDGFVRKLVGIIGFALAIILSVLFKDEFGLLIEYSFGIEFYLSEIIAAITIFLAVILVFALLKRIIHPFDKVNNLINQIIGGVVGIIQLLFFLSAVFLLLNIFDIPSKASKESSVFYKITYNIIPATIDILTTYTPDTKKIIKDYIEEKDSIG